MKSKKVFKDDKVTTILGIKSANPGHILLLPKKHYLDMPQVTEDELVHMFMVAKSLSNILLKTMKAKGTTIFAANGALAGQKAPHFMIHVIPRFDGDGLNFVPPEIAISDEKLNGVNASLCLSIGTLGKLSPFLF